MYLVVQKSFSNIYPHNKNIEVLQNVKPRYVSIHIDKLLLIPKVKIFRKTHIDYFIWKVESYAALNQVTTTPAVKLINML